MICIKSGTGIELLDCDNHRHNEDRNSHRHDRVSHSSIRNPSFYRQEKSVFNDETRQRSSTRYVFPTQNYKYALTRHYCMHVFLCSPRARSLRYDRQKNTFREHPIYPPYRFNGYVAPRFQVENTERRTTEEKSHGQENSSSMSVNDGMHTCVTLFVFIFCIHRQ